MGNPKRLARAPSSVVEQLLQVATEQRVLAQRGDDRLLKGIVVARTACVFLCLARPSPHSSRAMINGREIVGPGDVCRVVTARVLLW